MSIAGTIGEVGGGIAGGALGAGIGTALGGPIGAWIGRAVGSRLGRMAGRAAGEALANMMEKADEDAEANTKAEAADQTCKSCNPRCDELEKEMKEEMYANKRGPGGGGKHGLQNRRAEQICGAAGPGQTQMGYVIRNGQRILTQKDGWANHSAEIANQQQRLRDKLSEFRRLGCKPKNTNLKEAERMADRSFNPSPSEWLGPNHPSCNAVRELMRRDVTPELPTLPKPPSNPGPGNSGGIPTS
jgi:uncharacterized protein YcfJ